MNRLTRLSIRDHLSAALEADPRCLALSEGGSAAFGRADAESDLDLVLVVTPGTADALIEEVHGLVEELGTVELEWDVPRTLVEGHRQRFWRLAETGPLVLIDLSVIPADRPPYFTDPVRHGTPVICFDPDSLLVPVPEDRDTLTRRREQALVQIAARFSLFGPFAAKEARRGRGLDALTMWRRMVLDPLITVLRARHDPVRWDFGGRYLHTDLPPEPVSRLERLAFVDSAEAIVALWPEAEAWMDELLGG